MRRNRHRTARWTSVAAALSLVLASCGGDDDDAGADTAEATAESDSTDEGTADEPADEPAEEPADEPADEPAAEPAEEPEAEPADEPADAVAYPRTIEHALGTTELAEEPMVILPMFGELLGEQLVALGIEPAGALPYMSALPATGETYGLESLYDVPPIGTGFEPNLELIAAIQPDLIISDDQFFAAFYEPLSGIAPTYTLNLFTDDWKANFRAVADVVGRSDRAEEVIAQYDDRVAEIAPDVEAFFGDQSVAIVQQSLPGGGTGDGGVDGARIYGADTNPGRFLTDLGIEVWEPADPGGSEIAPSTYAVSFEIIPSIDADVILYLIEDSFMEVRSTVEESELWAATAAAQAGNFLFLDFGAQVRLGGPLHKFVAIDAVAALLAGEDTGGVADAPVADPPPTEDAGGTTIIDAGAEGGATLIGQFTAFSPDLAAAIDGPGPITVFLVSDEALGALQVEQAELAAALQADFVLLDEILRYHAIVDAALLADDLSGVTEVMTLLGEPITVEVVDGTVVLNGGQATVVAADLLADNGVGHVIDGLLIPPSRAAELAG